MWAAIKKRLQNKAIFVFIAGLVYKILQDCGAIVPPDQWKYYLDAVVYLLTVGGFFVSFDTPGLKDPEVSE